MLLSEKAMAPHSSTLAWKIPRTEEPGRLQSMGSRRFRHDWATSLSLFTFLHWRRKWQPTPVFLPGESQGRGSLVGCLSMRLHRVGHDWSDLAAAFSYFLKIQGCIIFLSVVCFCFCFFSLFLVRRVSSRYCFNGWFCFALYFTNNFPFCGFQTSLSMGLCSAL